MGQGLSIDGTGLSIYHIYSSKAAEALHQKKLREEKSDKVSTICKTSLESLWQTSN